MLRSEEHAAQQGYIRPTLTPTPIYIRLKIPRTINDRGPKVINEQNCLIGLSLVIICVKVAFGV